jgi:hypothetical protein
MSSRTLPPYVVPISEGRPTVRVSRRTNCVFTNRTASPEMENLSVLADSRCGKATLVMLPCGRDALIRNADLAVA